MNLSTINAPLYLPECEADILAMGEDRFEELKAIAAYFHAESRRADELQEEIERLESYCEYCDDIADLERQLESTTNHNEGT